ncbi:hypothetical protein F8M41_003203 [Gigaspora margarita]|uniref:Uncharacterized protein n=1 Tax=Gigaspora margarita TaxID=4874 RepID=A0A8H4ES74_GIGMA|nr:hypothetical protein F8M41_003203 [Gigaspora margarita]
MGAVSSRIQYLSKVYRRLFLQNCLALHYNRSYNSCYQKEKSFVSKITAEIQDSVLSPVKKLKMVFMLTAVVLKDIRPI